MGNFIATVVGPVVITLTIYLAWICVYETRKCKITFSPKSTLKRCLECYYTGMTVSFGIIKFSAYKVNNDGLATIKSRYRIQFDIPSTTFENKHTLIRETRRA